MQYLKTGYFAAGILVFKISNSLTSFLFNLQSVFNRFLFRFQSVLLYKYKHFVYIKNILCIIFLNIFIYDR